MSSWHQEDYVLARENNKQMSHIMAMNKIKQDEGVVLDRLATETFSV